MKTKMPVSTMNEKTNTFAIAITGLMKKLGATEITFDDSFGQKIIDEEATKVTTIEIDDEDFTFTIRIEDVTDYLKEVAKGECNLGDEKIKDLAKLALLMDKLKGDK